MSERYYEPSVVHLSGQNLLDRLRAADFEPALAQRMSVHPVAWRGEYSEEAAEGERSLQALFREYYQDDDYLANWAMALKGEDSSINAPHFLQALVNRIDDRFQADLDKAAPKERVDITSNRTLFRMQTMPDYKL